MTEKEALRLLDTVELHLGPDRAQARKIGNGEHVVLLLAQQRSDLDFYLWSLADFRAWQHEHTPARKQERRLPLNKRLIVVQRAVDTTQPATLHLPVSI